MSRMARQEEEAREQSVTLCLAQDLTVRSSSLLISKERRVRGLMYSSPLVHARLGLDWLLIYSLESCPAAEVSLGELRR